MSGCGCYGSRRYSADHFGALVSLPYWCVGTVAFGCPWELLIHGMGIERTHPGVWSADVVGFLASFGYSASLVAALSISEAGAHL